jgi:hypothetical protein
MVLQRYQRVIGLLAFGSLGLLAGSGCSGSSSNGATAPSRRAAAFVVSAFSVTFDQASNEHQYGVRLTVRETGGQIGATLGTVEFTFAKDGSSFATATVDNAWQPSHVAAGASMDARAITIHGTDLTRPIATRLTVRVNFVDDNQVSGAITQSADVPQPPTAPSPPTPPTPPTPPATTYTLSCLVQDDATNAGLSDAQVQVLDGANTGKSTVSSSNGQCSLGGLTAGSFTVRVTRSGYQTLDKSVTLPSDTRIEFKLKTTSNPTPTPTPPGGSMTCSGSVPSSVSCGTPTAQCKDGTWSCSQNRSGTCSSHGGVSCWVCPGTLCEGIREHTRNWLFTGPPTTASPEFSSRQVRRP